MNFAAIEKALIRRVCTPENDARFCESDPVFWACGTASAVVAHLRSPHPERQEQRNRLLRALVHQQATRREPVWLDAITLAFLPMLRRLELGVDDAPDDVVAQILFAFVSAVRKMPERADGKDALALCLRRETERGFYRALRRDCAYHARHTPLAEDDDWEPLDPVGPDLRRCDLELLVERLIARAPAEVRATLHTLVGAESLRDYARRLQPSDPPEKQTRAYEALRRRRSRELARLRAPATNSERPRKTA